MHLEKYIRQQHKNNKTEIIAPTGNDEFELPDGSYSVSDNQDYINYIIKILDTFSTNRPIYIYINRINNRLVFKTKDGFKSELQTSETMNLFDSTKKLTEKQRMEKMHRGFKWLK